MRNVAIVQLAVALVIVSVFAYLQTTTLSIQEYELRTALARSTSANLDLQERCTKQAAETISYVRVDDSDPFLYYQGHYNSTPRSLA